MADTPADGALPGAGGTAWRYRIEWRAASRPTGVLGGTWLVLVPGGSRSGPGSEPDVANLVQALADVGAEVVEHAVDALEADRDSLTADLKSLLDTGPGPGPGWSGVVSLLAWDERPRPGHPAVVCGLAATLATVQALGDLGVETRVWALTRGAVAVGAGEWVTAPAQAQVWGLGFVAALEHPELWGGLVDVDGGAFPAGVLAGVEEDQVAVRGGETYVRRLVADDDADAPAPGSASASVAWPPSGTVLITGGTGGLGAEAARWAADSGARHLLLLSRRGLGAPGADSLKADLERRGCVVTIEACDVAEPGAVRRVLDAVPADLPVSAVLHTAGADHLRPLMSTDVGDLAVSLSAKVLGAGLLDELLDDASVEVFIGFSSVAGVWGGGGGLTGYAAANAHLDALLDRRRGRGRAASAVAWGPWAGAGMAEANEDGTRALRRFGLAPMEPAPALDELRRLVELGRPAVLVADVDWERFALAYTYSRPSRLLVELAE